MKSNPFTYLKQIGENGWITIISKKVSQSRLSRVKKNSLISRHLGVFSYQQLPESWLNIRPTLHLEEGGLQIFQILHPLQLTQPLKIGHPNRKLVFQPSIFRCYVRFREGHFNICPYFVESLELGVRVR